MSKASAGSRAAQFLAQIGTAGGPVGAGTAPGLVSYGAGTLREQLTAGNTDPYALQRMGGTPPTLGAPAGAMSMATSAASPMPANLETGYIHLNMPGSPLPMHGLMTNYNVHAAQANQHQITMMEQQMLNGAVPPRGQLPMLPIQAAIGAAQQLGARAAQQRGGR